MHGCFTNSTHLRGVKIVPTAAKIASIQHHTPVISVRSSSKLSPLANHQGQVHLTLTSTHRVHSHRLASAASETANTMPSEEPAETPTYAPLHDFCMMIPYSVAALSIGIITFFLGTGILGIATAVNGAVVAGLAALSLKQWKNGTPTKLYAGIGFVTTMATFWLYYPFLHIRLPPLQHTILLTWVAVTCGMVMFLLVNVLMGGNPPKGYVKPKQE